MVDGYGGQHDFTNQYLPQEERFQSGWREFPNFLKTETGDEKRENFGEEISKAGNYLPFKAATRTAWTSEAPEEMSTVEKYFPSFKEQSERRAQKQDWRAFLDEKPARQRFTPTEVPSILKGMPRPMVPASEIVDYTHLEEVLLLEASDMMIFIEDETQRLEDVPKKSATAQKETETPSQRKRSVTTTAQSVQKQTQNRLTTTNYQPALRKPLSQAQEIVQETAVQQLPKTQKSKQRRAMKKSLSMIMEQEKGTQILPYSY